MKAAHLYVRHQVGHLIQVAFVFAFVAGLCVSYPACRFVLRRLRVSSRPRALIACAVVGWLAFLPLAGYLTLLVGGHFLAAWAEYVAQYVAPHVSPAISIPFGLVLGGACVWGLFLSVGAGAGAIVAKGVASLLGGKLDV